jgi:hypothetical protein
MTAALDKLRKKSFVYAVIAIAVVVIIEIGSHFVLKAGGHTVGSGADFIRLTQDNDVDPNTVSGHQPPGLGIPYLALIDGLLLYTLLLMVLGIVAPKEKVARSQGLVTLILMIIFIFATIVLAILALVKLFAMVTLFVAAPFGTIAYLAIFGNFDVNGAAGVLAAIMALKLFFCIQLVIANQRFLKMKGLVLLVLTSLVCTFLIGFLHGIVPGVLVSITDAIAALVIAIIAIIWAIVLLIGSIIAVVKAI